MKSGNLRGCGKTGENCPAGDREPVIASLAFPAMLRAADVKFNATAARAMRFPVLLVPANSVERVASFLVRHAHDFAEAECPCLR